MNTIRRKSLRIGLLATGNEITEGDIINTNGPTIARELIDHRFQVGLHVLASDAEEEIVQALEFLLAHHDGVIITGGLGPTSDDRTRFALSKVIKKELVFHEPSWQALSERIWHFLQHEPHPSNRQQALFPADAEIFPNPNGTAAGCYVTYKDKLIFMLPGPPNECLPMFTQQALPILLQQLDYTQQNIRLKWRLLGASEGEIAAQVDQIAQGHPVITGYRFDSPYLEVKIYSEPHAEMEAMQQALQQALAPYLISTENHTASTMLKQAFSRYPEKITICDQATFGALQTLLLTPANKNQIHFDSHTNADTPLHINLTGLDEFWQGKPAAGQTQVTIELFTAEINITKTVTIPYRNQQVICYAVEYICYAILVLMRTYISPNL